MVVESITAFIQVIDRLIQLVDRREKVNRAMFMDFVVPVMADFELVHQDYIESAKRYIALLEDKTVPFNDEHPIFESIRQDRLLAAHLKQKARVLCIPYSSENSKKQDTRLNGLALEMSDYFGVVDFDIINRHRPPTHAPGGSFRQLLERSLRELYEPVPADDASELATRLVWETLDLLQDHYGRVFKEYNELKQQLLQPI